MKLFDIQGKNVIIHNDSLGIPCFRKIWEQIEDKALATSYISYIVFKNKFDSPYVEAFSIEDREPHLKLQLFNDRRYVLPKLVLDSEQEYIRLTETLFIGLLKSARDRLESISKYYKEAITEGLDDDRIKVIIMALEKLGNVAKSIESLEDKARKEETFNLNKIVRGGGQIGAFEMKENAA